ncbi:MAG TPA: M13 family metallopeptidase [Acidimicrobiia bacterium]|nr:M13 family metallopeptidase [Acidimicrobiia bacterium]
MAIRDHLDPSNFDLSTPPGVDFYRHANGGWLDANPVPPEYPAWGAAFEVHVRNEEILHDLLERAAAEDAGEGTPTRMVGDYFAAGMDEHRIAEVDTAPLMPALDAIDSLEDVSGLQDLMLTLIPMGVGVFHTLDVQPDFEDADRYLVYLSQGGLGLPERDYYLRDDDRSKALVSAYLDHVTNQLENVGAGGRAEAEAIFDVEKRLAEASLPAEQHRDLERILNRHDVESLDDLMPRFGLSGYVRRLGVTSPSVNIDHAGFFTTLDQVMAETPIETIRHYLKWHLVRRYATALPARFEEEAFDFYNRKLGGQQQPRERWTRVLSAAATDIGELVARLYVDTAFSPEAKERCEQMVDGLIEAMGRSIRSREWMSEETKEAALAKVQAFTYKIGYPDVWRDYSGMEISRSSYVENRIRSARFEHQRTMGRLDQPVDKGEWVLPAHVVNAYYNPLHNEVVFPAGILQPPFFYPDADDAVNYGGIGSIIGHEITHGFDDNGSRFDEQGRRRNWWTEADRTEFERRAEVLVEQFSEYRIDDTQSVNGRLTLGENIADLGGLKIAFDAFLASSTSKEDLGGFTPIQRFFLAYATIWRMNYTDEYLRMLVNVDVHAPNPFRANGPLSNFPPFAEAFGIEEGSPMRRSEVAEIW